MTIVPFADILAQDDVLKVLRRSLTEDQVGHALLFMGPEGIGKRATAVAYAKALNCSDPQARNNTDFCDRCRSCRMITLGQHPDVRLLTPESTGGKTVIPIDAIRTRIGESPSHPLPLREDARLKPLEGRYKVYILDPANRPGFQEEAGNALLLTLEEPPPYVVIILISARPSAVLPTLVSRSRPLRFHLASRESITGALLKLGTLTPQEASAIAGMAGGRIGWALSVAANARGLEIRHALFETIDRCLPCGRPAGLRLAETLRLLATTAEFPTEGEEDERARVSADRQVRRNLPDLLDMLASIWRDLMVISIGQRDVCINADYVELLERYSGLVSEQQWRTGLQAVMQTRRMIERNANIDLALERMAMSILP